jgi:hypothetical protein
VPSQPAVLVVVPCGRAKVWDKNPQAGSTAACDAYIGSPFKVNRQYAERFGDRWVILSAKHGFLRPHDRVPEPYDVTFKRQSSRPISATTLRQQARALGLDHFDDLIGLGGKDYRRVLEEVFAGSGQGFTFLSPAWTSGDRWPRPSGQSNADSRRRTSARLTARPVFAWPTQATPRSCCSSELAETPDWRPTSSSNGHGG